MTLDLTPYQAPLPYPQVRHVQPDQKLAARLWQGYSGEYSELTTVLQYAYHSLCCKKQVAEISRTMRGIFYVETLHMELLGDALVRLGDDPRYLVAMTEKRVCWQGELVDYGATPAQMLLSDMEGEKRAAAFYEDTAGQTKQPELKHLLTRLAEDERYHVQLLSQLYNKFFQRPGNRPGRGR